MLISVQRYRREGSRSLALFPFATLILHWHDLLFPCAPLPELCFMSWGSYRHLVKGCVLPFMHMLMVVAFQCVVKPTATKEELPLVIALFSRQLELFIASHALSPACLCNMLSRSFPAELSIEVQRSRAASVAIHVHLRNHL